MKDTMRILRIAIYNALQGHVSIAGTTVNVYDEKRRVNQTDNLYIILSTQQEDDGSQTSDSFITRSTIDLEILQKTGYEVTKDVIDDISDQVLQLLIPTPASNGLSANNFQFNNVRRTRAISRNFSTTESETIIGKILTISCDITEQNN